MSNNEATTTAVLTFESKDYIDILLAELDSVPSGERIDIDLPFVTGDDCGLVVLAESSGSALTTSELRCAAPAPKTSTVTVETFWAAWTITAAATLGAYLGLVHVMAFAWMLTLAR